jgi:hypothetical protein
LAQLISPTNGWSFSWLPFPHQFGLNFLHRRQAAFEFVWKFLDDLGFPLGNTDWFLEITQ